MIGFLHNPQIGSASTKKYIAVISYDTEEVVKKIDVTGKSESQIDRIENGLNINLNHNKFYTMLITE